MSQYRKDKVMGFYDPNQSVNGALTSQKLVEQQYNEARAEADKWHQCAELALKKGREDLARKALTRKHEFSKTAASLKTQLEQLRVKIDNPKGNSANQAPDRKNPKEILEKSILDTREAVKLAVEGFERIQQQYGQARKEANDSKEQTLIALQKDDNNLALVGLIDKTVQGKNATAFKTQLEQQLVIVELLKQNLTALESVKEMLAAHAFAEINSEWVDNEAFGCDRNLTSPDQTVDVEWESLGAQIDRL